MTGATVEDSWASPSSGGGKLFDVVFTGGCQNSRSGPHRRWNTALLREFASSTVQTRAKDGYRCWCRGDSSKVLAKPVWRSQGESSLPSDGHILGIFQHPPLRRR